MKHLLNLILCLFISTITYCQTIEKLDEKNGFKDFKLGDSFYKWQNNLNYQGSKNNVKRYLYNGTCCSTIYEYPINSILLDFVDNKLVQISLLHKTVPESGSYTKVDIAKIYSRLIDSFGAFSTKDTSDEGKAFMYWFGKKVDLLYVWTYLGASVGQNYEIFIYDKAFLEKEKADGF